MRTIIAAILLSVMSGCTQINAERTCEVLTHSTSSDRDAHIHYHSICNCGKGPEDLEGVDIFAKPIGAKFTQQYTYYKFN